MIKKIIAVLFIWASLSGCVASQQYGNFLTQQQIKHEEIVASAILQLTEYYPPANTQLYLLSPPSTDVFGCDLITKLRLSGYKVYEHQPNDTKSTGSLNFKYIIDSPKDAQGSTPFIRLTLFIEKDVMTCGFDNETLQPICLWSKGKV